MRTFATLASILLLAGALAGCTGDTPTPTPTPTSSTPAATPTPTPTATPVPPLAGNDDFEGVALGGVPLGWTVSSGNWSVRENETAPAGSKVLFSDATALPETSILHVAAGQWSDVAASVSFTVMGGESGQAGGITFRHEDGKNYYVVRYNHLEGQWNLFRTIDGKRQKFPGTEAAAASFVTGLDQWIDLDLKAEGSHITVTSGDLLVIDYREEDSRAPTSGNIGLWTRYDSRVEFDDFRVGSV